MKAHVIKFTMTIANLKKKLARAYFTGNTGMSG